MDEGAGLFLIGFLGMMLAQFGRICQKRRKLELLLQLRRNRLRLRFRHFQLFSFQRTNKINNKTQSKIQACWQNFNTKHTKIPKRLFVYKLHVCSTSARELWHSGSTFRSHRSCMRTCRKNSWNISHCGGLSPQGRSRLEKPNVWDRGTGHPTGDDFVAVHTMKAPGDPPVTGEGVDRVLEWCGELT